MPPFLLSRIVVICFVLVSIFGLAQEPTESEIGGRDLYRRYQCWQCHGYEGQGGAAARLATQDYPFEAFEQIVRRPNLMPAYTSELLSDKKLRSIYDYVRSIPEPPALEDIPVLRDN